jgi:hypothetical protein
MFLTILAAIGGVVVGYFLVSGIVSTFAKKSCEKKEPTTGELLDGISKAIEQNEDPKNGQ